tara:strand:- start:6687 stop:7367 length:681 start_codon:yes stop_codon:yes gene_type:complete
LTKESEYHFYFVDEKLNSFNSQDLGKGSRILKISSDSRLPSTISKEGPFISIDELKKSSNKFNFLLKRDPRRAQKICKNDRIYTIKNSGNTFLYNNVKPEDLIKTILHATHGSVKNGKVSGVHFYNNEKMKIVEIIKKKQNGVFQARFKLYDEKTKRWIEKESTSTFFPENWSLKKLFDECGYALSENQCELIMDTKNRYKSYTKSGIEVIIIKINNNIKTIYPAP